MYINFILRVDLTLQRKHDGIFHAVYQLARIETHLAVLPKRGEDGRLSPPEQIASALASRFRIAEARSIDADSLVAAEDELMRLSDVIAATYFTSHERTETAWEALG